jgi:hypothetical protein
MKLEYLTLILFGAGELIYDVLLNIRYRDQNMELLKFVHYLREK